MTQSGLALVRAELERALAGASVGSLGDEIIAARRVFVAGAGRSGALLGAFANRLVHLGLAVHRVGDITTPAIAPGDLLVVASNSGTTSGPLRAAQVARDVGARVAVITGTLDSPLAEGADVVVAVAVLPSRQPMGSLFEQATFLLLEGLVLDLKSRRGIPEESMRSIHANIE